MMSLVNSPATFTKSEPRLAYRDMPASNPALEAATPYLLLHGVGSSSASWDELSKHLDGRRIIAPDYRGHGQSDAPTPPYIAEDFVADALRIMDELGLAKVILVGFSIGALFAARIALEAPQRVERLVLVSSIANRSPEQRERAETRSALIRETPPSETAPGSAVRWFSPSFLQERPDLVGLEVQVVSANRHQPYAASYQVLVENDPIGIVEGISVPTLVITGENDEGSTPDMSKALHARIKDSRLVIEPAVKHYIQIEKAARLAAEILDFVGADQAAQ
jgi:pimeloyl-ACP methyl ester carboxylesterase